MPSKAARPCAKPACPLPAITRGRCSAHAQAYDQRRGSSSQRGYGSAWVVKRNAYLATHPDCEWSGCGAPATEVDHRIALKAGGADDETNYQALCGTHHRRKTIQYDGGFGRLPGMGVDF